MNTQITEDYCSFEVAKLLKEKGFNEDSWFHYDTDGDIVTRGYRLNHPDDIPAWTHQMARKWLRKIHHIYADPIRQGVYDDLSENYSWIVARNGVIYRNQTVTENLSYEEACEEAIKYCLTNLI